MRVVRDFSTRTVSKSDGDAPPSEEEASDPAVGEGLAPPAVSARDTIR